MISRLPISILSVVLAFTIAPAAWAAPDAPGQTAAPATAIYDIDNHNQQVTIKDETGRVLLTCRAATPTIQAVIVKSDAVGVDNSPAADAPQQATLTLEDQNGLRLWSTLVPVVSPLNVNFKTGDKLKGMRIIFTHLTDGTSSPDLSTMPRMVLVMGADDHATSMKFDDKEYKLVSGSNSASIIGPNGNTEHLTVSDTGSTIKINGTQITIEKVTKDGKSYVSFPWNGHKVLIEDTCTFTVGTDGDLTVDGPSGSK